MRLKELQALAQRHTARKGRSGAEIAVSWTLKPNNWEVLKVSQLLG